MSQFTVYLNPDKSTRHAYPYMVDIQHSIIDELPTRLVIPLGRLADYQQQTIETLTPTIDYQGESLVLLTHQMAAIPVRLLKTPIGSIDTMRDEIIAAIDLAISGF